MRHWLVLVITVMALTGCYQPPRGGGVTPAPPGPVDLLSIILGNDYSRLCPTNYDYCRAGKRSICCPRGACCGDASSPYCCDSRGYDAAQSDYDRGGPGDQGPCGPRSTTCSRAGVTICCADDEGCCADERGLYCCAASGREPRY
jgi:hypothetical protein